MEWFENGSIFCMCGMVAVVILRLTPPPPPLVGLVLVDLTVEEKWKNLLSNRYAFIVFTVPICMRKYWKRGISKTLKITFQSSHYYES